MKEDKEKITFYYQKSPEYKTLYANGVFGGPTTRGEIKLDFFIESFGAPKTMTNSVTPDGLGPEIDRDPSPNRLIRELQIGVVMAPNQLKALVAFIQNHLRQLETIKPIEERK